MSRLPPLLLALFATVAHAHGVHHELAHGEAVVLWLYHSEEAPFSQERYEVFRPGEETAFQQGRTDALGRIVWQPDRAGEWRVRAFSEDGHGVDLTLQVDETGTATAAHGRLEDYALVLAGLAIILGLFGLVGLLTRRKT